jgi:uncharacterized repeat protein (TIGR02543 family)
MFLLSIDRGDGTIETPPEKTPVEKMGEFFSNPVLWIVILCLAVAVLVAILIARQVKQHQAKEFTIMLNNDGDIETMVAKQGEHLRLPLIKREGYRFAGWFTDTACTVPYLQTTKIHSDLMLYAKWVKEAD